MERPKGLINVRIDPKTGQPGHVSNPNTIFEVFRLEYAPKSTTETKQPDVFIDINEGASNQEQLF